MASYQVKNSSTAYPLVFLMVDSTNHIDGKPGLTPTVTISKAGAAFASPAGAVSEIGNGWYKVAGNATDTATLGPLLLHATGSGADMADMIYEVVAVDPQDAVHYGLSALPNAAANANGGLPILSSSGTTLAYTVSTLTTYTGNTVQTGDAYARIGANGAALTALGDARVAYLDVPVSTRSTYTGGSVVLAANGLDAITVETGVNARQALSPILAACAGVLSGASASGGTILIQAGANPATNRISSVTDNNGNRTAVTLSLPT